MSDLKVPFQEFLDHNRIKVGDLPEHLRSLVVEFGELIKLHDEAPDLNLRNTVRGLVEEKGDEVYHQLQLHFDEHIDFNCDGGDFCPQVVEPEILPLTLWDSDEDILEFLYHRFLAGKASQYVSDEMLAVLGFSAELGQNHVPAGSYQLTRKVFWNNYKIEPAPTGG